MAISINYGRILNYMSLKARTLNIPIFGTFELTPLCNMNCKMCYIRMTKEEMDKVGTNLSADEWIRIAQEAVAEGMTMLLFTGGEAILHKDFKKIYLAIRKMGLFISINTNGTILNDEWISFFKKYPPSKFNITLYGGSNETYARLCRNPRGFDQVKKAIEKLQENNIEILLNCTLTKENASDIAPIFKFANEHNLEVHATTYNFPPVRKEGVDNLSMSRFTPKEAAKAKVLMNWYKLGKNNFIKLVNEVNNDKFLDDSYEVACGDGEGDKVLCAAGRANFWITWDGRILPCGMIPNSSVQVKNRSFKEVWDKVVKDTSGISLAPECKNCNKKKYCSPCAAKLFAETGSFDKKSEYMCEYVDEYLNLLKISENYLK